VNISSCGEQSVSSDEDDFSDNSSMRHGVWANSGFPFTGKPGMNIDFKDPSKPLEYSELFYAPEIAEVIARETNQYAQKLLENMPN
jgi:hypothetical protein